METSTRTQRVRHGLLGAALVLGPACIATSSFLQPDVDWENSEAVVMAAAANPGRWQIAGLIGFFGFALLVPVAIAAAGLVRRLHPALALTSTVLMGAGGIMIASVIVADFTLAAATTADAAVMGAWHERVEDLPGAIAMFPLFFAGLAGILVLAFALFRAKATAVWVPVLMAVSIGVVFFADGGTVAAQVFEVGLALSFWGVAYRHFTQRPEADAVVIPEDLATAPPTPAV
jgi:hypothetical protein